MLSFYYLNRVKVNRVECKIKTTITNKNLSFSLAYILYLTKSFTVRNFNASKVVL